ncbi:MAG: FliH/SctL family protein [Pseudomonadota bacterium]
MTGIFQRNFDQERLHGGALAAAALTTDGLALDQLKQRLRAEGYAEGHGAGLAEARQEAADDRAKLRQLALDTLAQRAAALHRDAEAHRRALEHQLLEFALNTCERVLPEILEATSKDRAVDSIKRCIALAGGVPTLRVTVSDAVLQDHGAAIADAFGAGNEDMRVSVQADPAMQDGDARVEWQHGSMEFSLARITESIVNAVRQALAEHHPQTTDILERHP